MLWYFFKNKTGYSSSCYNKALFVWRDYCTLSWRSSVVSAISGLGTLFIHKDFKSKILRTLIYPIYRIAFNHPNQKIIFQNNDDARTLIDWGVVNSKIELLTGSGVNLKILKYKRTIWSNYSLFAARLLIDKEYMNMLKQQKF